METTAAFPISTASRDDLGERWQLVAGVEQEIFFHNEPMTIRWTRARDLKVGDLIREVHWTLDPAKDSLATVREITPLNDWGNGCDLVLSNGKEPHCSANAPFPVVVGGWAV